MPEKSEETIGKITDLLDGRQDNKLDSRNLDAANRESMLNSIVSYSASTSVNRNVAYRKALREVRAEMGNDPESLAVYEEAVSLIRDHELKKMEQEVISNPERLFRGGDIFMPRSNQRVIDNQNGSRILKMIGEKSPQYMVRIREYLVEEAVFRNVMRADEAAQYLTLLPEDIQFENFKKNIDRNGFGAISSIFKLIADKSYCVDLISYGLEKMVAGGQLEMGTLDTVGYAIGAGSLIKFLTETENLQKILVHPDSKKFMDSICNSNYNNLPDLFKPEQLKLIASQPYGREIMQNMIAAIEKTAAPTGVFIFKYLDYFADMPYAADYIRPLVADRAYAGKIEVFFGNLDKFTDKPWAGEIMLLAAKNYPSLTLLNYQKYFRQKWFGRIIITGAGKDKNTARQLNNDLMPLFATHEEQRKFREIVA